MPIYDFECGACKEAFDRIVKTDTDNMICPKCGATARRVFPKKAPRTDLKYNPKTDVCDWDGNTTQYYRKYNEAKDRGENVRLPEKGE